MYSTHGNPCVHFSGPTGPIVDPTSTKRYHKIVYLNVNKRNIFLRLKHQETRNN